MPACTNVEARTGASVGKSEEKEPAGCYAVTTPRALWRLRLGAGRRVDRGRSSTASFTAVVPVTHYQ